MSLIDQRKGIPSSSPLWNELEDLILIHSPNFMNALLQLTNGKMTKADRQIALLVRFGISPSGMATLLNLTSGAISARRINLGSRMLGMDLSTKQVDAIIRLL